MFVPMTRMVHIPRIISAPRDPGAIVGKAFALVLPGVIGGYNQYGLLTVKMDQNKSNSVMLRSRVSKKGLYINQIQLICRDFWHFSCSN